MHGPRFPRSVPDPAPTPSRRQFLVGGLAGGLGLALGPARLARALAAAREPQARSVIHIFLPGGLSHIDSFDPKPYAPVEYRGPFRAIDTSLPGVRFSEVWKYTAQVADKLTVCRSLHHSEAAHERGTHNLFTGYRPSPALQYPSLGSVVSHELGVRNHLPPYVCIPRQPNVYAGSGYLSTAYGPFSLGSSPESSGFAVRDLSLPKDVDEARFARRRALLDLVDGSFKETQVSDELRAVDRFYEGAYDLIAAPEAQAAFRIQEEPEDLRKKYGMNAPGQRMLLARRLVEAGVRFVSLTAGSFDHHDDIKSGLRSQAPAVDQAFAALLQDLDQRKALDHTLVMLTTEFGRTPKINGTAGRDHWPRVFSVVLAGGGIRRGQVYGSSTAQGDDVEADPLSVEELAHTMYHLIGIDAEKELLALGARPIEIVKGGRVVPELLA